MLHIDRDTIRIGAIADEWATRLNTFLTEDGHNYSVSYPNPSNPKEKLEELCDTYQAKMLASINHCFLVEADKIIAKSYIKRFCSNIEFYAKANEEELRLIHDMCLLLKANHPKIHEELKKVFVDLYKDFTSIRNKPHGFKVPVSYHFVGELKIRTCPYCNRTYTFNIHKDNGKKARPEYDHFYDKEENPLLAVSFYNLVPACPICNHIKSTSALHINPFFHRFRGAFRVFNKPDEGADRKPLNAIQLSNRGAWGDVCLDTEAADEKLDMETLGLDEFYKQHVDYVEEIVEKAQMYREPMLSDLSSAFQGAGYSPKQVFDFVWGKNVETARNINQPLSKLTRDILEQVGIINNPNYDSEAEVG